MVFQFFQISYTEKNIILLGKISEKNNPSRTYCHLTLTPIKRA